MRLPRMTAADLAVFAACYAASLGRQAPTADNSSSDAALDEAFWHVECFKRSMKERKR